MVLWWGMTKKQQDRTVDDADGARVLSYHYSLVACYRTSVPSEYMLELAGAFMAEADRLEAKLPKAWGPAGSNDLNRKTP